MSDPIDRETSERGALEDQRSFLLRSLDDLEAERADGNIDEQTFARLHDDYTARAAHVLHRLDGDLIAGPIANPIAGPIPNLGAGAAPSVRRRVIVGLAVLAFATVAGITLSYGLGARLPGETITGRQGETAAEASNRQVRQLRAAIRAHPEDGENRLALARILMGRRDYGGAVTEFQAAARIDPTNPEPLAYSGWLLRLQGFPDQGLTLLDRALEISPDYADARFFKGTILLRDRNDPDAAIGELQQYLVSAPDSPLADQVRSLLAEAVEAQRAVLPSANPSTPSHPSTTSPTSP